MQWYGELQQRQSSDEYAATQRTISALNGKIAAIERINSLQEMQDEVAALGSGTKTATLQLNAMGLDGIKSRIEELQAMLDDLNHPVTDRQRHDILDTMAAYEDYRKVLANTFSTYREGWNGLKDMGSGIQAITEALHGQGDAWSVITGLVDGFLQLYDGIMGVVKIIDLLTSGSQLLAASKGAEASATGASTLAAAAENTEAAAALPVKAATAMATKAEASSYLELAASMYMAAHAYIPFAGFAIGAGFASSAAALVAGMGAVPLASGAIVSGPTMALIGEYAGASNNPEIVAPLDKLRSLIEPQGDMADEVDFKIRGRRLVGLLEKEGRRARRNG